MCWLCLGIGIILGAIVTNLIVALRSSAGTFLIDSSDPEKDVYKLELGDLTKLPKKHFILVKIKSANLPNDSQK